MGTNVLVHFLFAQHLILPLVEIPEFFPKHSVLGMELGLEVC